MLLPVPMDKVPALALWLYGMGACLMAALVVLALGGATGKIPQPALSVIGGAACASTAYASVLHFIHSRRQRAATGAI